MSSTRIPGGRGPRVTEDAIPGQEESYASRSAQLVPETKYYYYTLGAPTAPTELISAAAGDFNMVPLPPFSGDSVFVSSTVALNSIDTPGIVKPFKYALYRFEDDLPARFIQVPQSAVETSEAGAPTKYARKTTTIPFAMNFKLDFDPQSLWLGYVQVESLLQFSGSFIDSPILASYIKLGFTVSTPLPKVINRTSFDARIIDQGYSIPAITYRTAYGVRMFGDQ